MSKTRRSSFEIVCVALHEESNDQAEQSKDSSEDLNRENLDEPKYVSQESDSVYWKTYSVGSAASANAALLPLMPTQTPQIKLHMPTVMPAQNSAYPVKMFDGEYICSMSLTWFSLAEKIMAMMTP